MRRPPASFSPFDAVWDCSRASVWLVLCYTAAAAVRLRRRRRRAETLLTRGLSSVSWERELRGPICNLGLAISERGKHNFGNVPKYIYFFKGTLAYLFTAALTICHASHQCSCIHAPTARSALPKDLSAILQYMYVPRRGNSGPAPPARQPVACVQKLSEIRCTNGRTDGRTDISTA